MVRYATVHKKINVKKLHLLLRTPREQYFVRRLSSLNTYVKRNWKASNSLIEKNKKSLRIKFFIDGVSTADTAKICSSFCNYFIDHQKKTSLNQSRSATPIIIIINVRLMYFCQATETGSVESIMQLNKEDGIKDVSRKFLIMCKNNVSYYLKELFNFCIDSFVFPIFFKLLIIHPFIKKGLLRNV